MSISLLSYVKADIHTAWSALNEIDHNGKNIKALKGIAAYHAQQAIEKMIKSEIYRVAPEVNPRKLYTHKIYDLCSIASEYGIMVPKGIVKNAGMYTDWETGGRYDLHFSVRKDSIKTALNAAEDWLKCLGRH